MTAVVIAALGMLALTFALVPTSADVSCSTVEEYACIKACEEDERACYRTCEPTPNAVEHARCSDDCRRILADCKKLCIEQRNHSAA